MFAWDDSKKPKRATQQSAEQRHAMYKRELEERAALLQRLGYTAARTKARLRANVAWDFELHKSPRHAADVDKIVDAVYRRGGMTGGTPSV